MGAIGLVLSKRTQEHMNILQSEQDGGDRVDLGHLEAWSALTKTRVAAHRDRRFSGFRSRNMGL
jgi:hypothetical protein